MVNHGDDSISKITQLMEPEDLAQNISLVESRIQIFALITKNGASIPASEKSQYLDVEYYAESTNWMEFPPQKTEFQPAATCELSMFKGVEGKDKESLKAILEKDAVCSQDIGLARIQGTLANVESSNHGF